MKNKLMANKVTIIVVLIIFIVVCVGIGALTARDSKKTENPDVGIETQQDEDDSVGLEVLETYDNTTEDKSDASGNWDDTDTSGSQNNKTENHNKTESNNKTEQDKNSNNNQKEILKDDINWGEIY